ncbi:helix-turn-helix transcriptional regulator [Brucella sp. JSBI001]|uniref:helix-turn-helix transcriptional regulator n=1 Tax=Brucella sp. JSBI001 TaxID=2886044 RepID=UPI0039B6FEE9
MPYEDRFIDVKEVRQLIGFSQAKIYVMVNEKTFPAPLKFGRASRWSLNTVREWMARKVREAA